MKEKVLITGFAGFIGTNLINQLSKHYSIIGVDSFSVSAFEPHYKKRLQFLNIQFDAGNDYVNPVNTDHHFYKADILQAEKLELIITKHQPKAIIHLAALTGVRQSFDNPVAYIRTNIQGTTNVFEAAKKFDINHIIYASSSSVYGQTEATSFSEEQHINSPLSIYGATKLADEFFAKTYFNAFGMNSVGLRFFTAYGPWNRPDMAAYGFVKKIEEGQSIQLFNGGNVMRDFTYVDDIVNAIHQLLSQWIKHEIKIDGAELYNIGGGQTITVTDFVKQIELSLNKEAIVENWPTQIGDMSYTRAATDKLWKLINYKPETPIEEGIKGLTEWYRTYVL